MEKKYFVTLMVLKMFEIYSVVYAYCMISLYYRKIKIRIKYYPQCRYVETNLSTDYILLSAGLFCQILFIVIRLYRYFFPQAFDFINNLTFFSLFFYQVVYLKDEDEIEELCDVTINGMNCSEPSLITTLTLCENG